MWGHVFITAPDLTGFGVQEVSDFVEGARNKKIRERHSASDEYDGLSPEEINKLKR